MSIYDKKTMSEYLSGNTYPGRGIVIGKSENGKYAVFAYFIMGRSVNSRNRVFVEDEENLKTKAFDESKLSDPSLIIYSPVRHIGKDIIVTNGDQTDTVYDGIKNGLTFSKSLEAREFEPDGPNFTPRISGLLHLDNGFTYEMSILKSIDEEGSACARFTYNYPSVNGLGHFIHTYVCDGNPIPTFQGEPERTVIPDCIDDFTKEIWENLNENNKISLYVCYTDIASGKNESRLINKNK